MMDERTRRTYYDELGLTPGARQKQIEQAYWSRLSGGAGRDPREREPGAADRAYAVLSDPLRRKSYDRLIGAVGHPAWQEEAAGAGRAQRLYCRALDLAGSRREGEALRLMKRCVGLRPGKALYRSAMALLLARTAGGVERGLRLGIEAYRQSPRDPGVVENLAAICELAGLKRRAAGLRKSLGESRRNPSPR